MLNHKLLVALSLATATLGCATHNYHGKLAKRQDGSNGGNSSSGPEASDWSYDASFDWGRVSPGESPAESHLCAQDEVNVARS